MGIIDILTNTYPLTLVNPAELMQTNKKFSSQIAISLTTVLFASFIMAYFPVWKNLALTWSTSDEYSYGFIILPVCCYIFWNKRHRLVKISVKPSKWGLCIIFLSLFVYLFAHYSEISTVASLSMVSFLTGMTIYFYGFMFFRELAFPLFFLLFMIPIPAQIYSSVTMPLQLLVSKCSVWLMFQCGLSIYREGNIIHLPEQTLSVVSACSGVRTMTSLLVLCTIYGYFTLRSIFLRSILVFAGVPIAILVNIFRVQLIVSALYFLNCDLTKGALHTFLGLYVFIFALILIVITKKGLLFWDK